MREIKAIDEGDANTSAVRAKLLSEIAVNASALRERALEAENLRRLPREDMAFLQSTGALRVWQPRAQGGWQLDMHAHLDIVEEIAAASAAAGWITGVMHANSWLLAQFEGQAQSDAYNTMEDPLIAAVFTPRGGAQKTQGGYRLSGRWPFCSGCHHAKWFLLGAQMQNEAGAAEDEGILLVPSSDVQIVDDWSVTGLRGTGSNSVIASKAFAPEHRTISVRDALNGVYRSSNAQDHALYRGAFVPVLALALTGSALGVARAALDEFRKTAPNRVLAYSFNETQSDSASAHTLLAEASAKIDTARLILHHCADDIEAAAENFAQMDVPARARVRFNCARAVRMCLEATDSLFLASGGSSLDEKNILQRASRDLHAINVHGLLWLPINQELYGRILFGLEPNSPLL